MAESLLNLPYLQTEQAAFDFVEARIWPKGAICPHCGGTEKNKRTNYAYKKAARILKRLENEMARNGSFRDLPSYFVECLAYNCPDSIFAEKTWTALIRAMVLHIWNGLQGEEPKTGRWVEVNECFYLFHSEQKWTRKDGREFAAAAWKHSGFQ